jgi:hypothetical protein
MFIKDRERQNSFIVPPSHRLVCGLTSHSLYLSNDTRQLSRQSGGESCEKLFIESRRYSVNHGFTIHFGDIVL